MKNLILIAVSLIICKIAQAQEIYISNEGQSSAGSHAVGSDSWLATGFSTGSNVGGYFLNSVSLEMVNASGHPNGFAAMVYSAAGTANFSPGSKISGLTGSTNPLTSGIYDYSPVPNLFLLPNTAYFIVLTSETSLASGAYESSYAGSFSYILAGGWQAPLGTFAVDNYQSSNGSTWNYLGGPTQFSITALPIPESSASWLLLLGGGICIYVRKRDHRSACARVEIWE
jgi:hypothetical protein